MSYRDYTKFFTCPETANFMVELLDPIGGESYLEPHAGNGALLRAIREKQPNAIICACELNPMWELDLKRWSDQYVIGDFLSDFHLSEFDGCIANPPFGNGIDLHSHFAKMREKVKEGGKIISIVPADFHLPVIHAVYPLENWSKNSDGTTTEIKIIEFFNNNKPL